MTVLVNSGQLSKRRKAPLYSFILIWIFNKKLISVSDEIKKVEEVTANKATQVSATTKVDELVSGSRTTQVLSTQSHMQLKKRNLFPKKGIFYSFRYSKRAYP